MDLRVSNIMELMDKVEEKSIQLESISRLLAAVPENTTLGTVQGSLWALASIAAEVAEAADMLRAISGDED